MADMMKQALEALKMMKEQNINLNDLMPKDIYSMIQNVIASLGQQAWIFMGMQANPFTQKVETDMKQAKVAIDCVISLTDIIKPYLAAKDAAELETLKSNLLLNYVQKSEKS